MGRCEGRGRYAGVATLTPFATAIVTLELSRSEIFVRFFLLSLRMIAFRPFARNGVTKLTSIARGAL